MTNRKLPSSRSFNSFSAKPLKPLCLVKFLVPSYTNLSIVTACQSFRTYSADRIVVPCDIEFNDLFILLLSSWKT